MRTFVFAIGGTGARVLRSLMMIWASDMNINKQEIIPLVVDLDDQNGDLERVLDLLRKYRELNKSINSGSFFSNRIGTLGSVTSTENSKLEGINDNFKLNFGNINETFYEYINGHSLDAIDKYLLELLYDDSGKDNPNTELNLTLDKGFKGNPNIGCVVFNDLVKTPEYKYFENVFTQGDKIFIISSIFGGTGSSGFPQLIENLNSSNNNHIKKSPKGALVVKPYFKVHQDEKSTINSDLFHSKTKAALSYYENELKGLADIYYIGDKATDPYENNMGGHSQMNNAHAVEFLGAKAVIKFLNQSDFSTTRYYEFGIEEMPTDRILNLNHFYVKENGSFWKPFIKLSLFCKIHKYLLSDYEYFDVFYKSIGLNKIDLHQFTSLNYFVDEFLKWHKELSGNKCSMNLFDLSSNDDLSLFIKGSQKNGVGNFKSKNVIKTLFTISNKISGTPKERYIEAINVFIEDNCQPLISI